MAEYIVNVGNADAEHVKLLGEQATRCFGHPVGEQIVRCRDCKFYTDHEWILITDVTDVCHFWHGEPTKVEPDGFCNWGERRGEE